MVAIVGFTAGSTSNGQSITVLATGQKTVALDVPLSEIDLVKIGQSARVAVDGFIEPLRGTVTKIGLLSSTSASSTTFPVTVTLTNSASRMHDGAGADVTITAGHAKNALLVPASAITTIGTRHVVSLVQAGKTTITRVAVGLAGTDTSQVTSGLKVGDKVQLADPGKALPSSATSGSNSAFPGSGRFPGFFSGGSGEFPNVTPGG
jgi:multidrug efflux pump subunit AcrA (membrane-fusion protein)